MKLLKSEIIKILKSLSKFDNKPILIECKNFNKKFAIEFDSIFPEGIMFVEGKTILAIENSGFKDIELFLRRAESFFPEYSNLIIVFCEDMKEQNLNDLRVIKNNFRMNIVIWDPVILDALLTGFETDISSVLAQKHLEINLTENFFTRDKWRTKSEFYTKEASQYFREKNTFFFLGAGISIDAGLPSWNEIMRNLHLKMIEDLSEDKITFSENETTHILEFLKNSSYTNNLIDASYLKIAFHDRFISNVRDTLYKNLKKDSSSEIIDSIGKSIRISNTPIITYNFDDLLEEKFEKLNIKHKSVYRENEFIKKGEVPIYHVHGFIPRKLEYYGNLEENLLVFSEDSYHIIESDYYHWTNLIQLNLLRNRVAIFIGMSFTDPNLRKILRILSTKSSFNKHYAIMKRQIHDEELLENKNINGFSNVHHELYEKMLGELNTKIIWFEDFDEIPEIIDQISSIG